MTEIAYLLPGKGVLQHGGAVQLQCGQGGQGTSQGVGGQAQETQADPTRLLQAAHQSTATPNTSLEHILVDTLSKRSDVQMLKSDNKLDILRML